MEHFLKWEKGQRFNRCPLLFKVSTLILLLIFVKIHLHAFFKSLTAFISYFYYLPIIPYLTEKKKKSALSSCLFPVFYYSSTLSISTFTFSRCQISLTYSSIVLSEENFPTFAIFKSADFAQPDSFLYASSTFFCASA